MTSQDRIHMKQTLFDAIEKVKVTGMELPGVFMRKYNTEDWGTPFSLEKFHLRARSLPGEEVRFVSSGDIIYEGLAAEALVWIHGYCEALCRARKGTESPDSFEDFLFEGGMLWEAILPDPRVARQDSKVESRHSNRILEIFKKTWQLSDSAVCSFVDMGQSTLFDRYMPHVLHLLVESLPVPRKQALYLSLDWIADLGGDRESTRRRILGTFEKARRLNLLVVVSESRAAVGDVLWCMTVANRLRVHTVILSSGEITNIYPVSVLRRLTSISACLNVTGADEIGGVRAWKHTADGLEVVWTFDDACGVDTTESG